MIPMTPSLSAEIDELDRLAKSRDDAWQISREQGELLAAAAIAHNAKLIVEIGTSYGFSGLWWSAALAMTSGHLHTIDVSEKKYNASRETFAKAGVAGRITSHFGDAKPILATMPDGIDLVFIDADKPATRGYFDLLWPKLRVGGAVMTDNILSHQKEMAGFVEYVRSREDAHSVTIPIRSGLEWTVKLR